MKVTLQEHEGCFEITMEPETIAEAALVIRFRMNATQEVRSMYAYASRDGEISGGIVLGKAKKSSMSIGRGKW